MQTSPNGVALIESNEGFSAAVYLDEGKPCIGFGHDLQPGESFAEGVTRAEAEQLLEQDLASRFEPTLNRLLPATATQNQYDACADFCYNEGPRNFATMIAHGWDQVPANMPKWCYAMKDGVETIDKDLRARRAAEVALFNQAG
jgi:GH24 family phage-related lysozyme (muramidase)